MARLTGSSSSRLFERVLLKQGREWIDRTSPRLAQYRSRTLPGYSDYREFRDFRRFDKVDARFGDWKEAEVEEVNWDEMTVLVQTLDSNSVYSSQFKEQREWIAMESDRLCEHRTKSLEGVGDLLSSLAKGVRVESALVLAHVVSRTLGTLAS